MNHPEEYHALVEHQDYQDNLVAAIDEYIGIGGKDILEFGAGTGRLTFKLSRLAHRVDAFEKYRGMIGTALSNKEKLGISNCTFRQADNLYLPMLEHEYDIAIEGWSFFDTITLSERGWEDRNTLIILKRLYNSMVTAVKEGGALVIMESLGTFTEEPSPDPLFERAIDILEEGFGFQRKVVRTDFRFGDAGEAKRLLTFFFGQEAAGKIRKYKDLIIPECTGIWYRTNDKVFVE